MNTDTATNLDQFLRHARGELIALGVEGHCTVTMSPEYAADVEIRTGRTLAQLGNRLGVSFVVDPDVHDA